MGRAQDLIREDERELEDELRHEEDVLRTMNVTSSSDERLYRLQREQTRNFERRTNRKFEKLFDWQDTKGGEIATIAAELKAHRETENGHGRDADPSFTMPHIPRPSNGQLAKGSGAVVLILFILEVMVGTVAEVEGFKIFGHLVGGS